MADHTHSVGFFAAEMLELAAQQHPQKTAIIAKEEQLTFSVLNGRVHALAAHLQKEGIHPGDRVGLLLPNSTAIPLSYYATQKIGAVTVILDARLKGKELQGVLRDADLKLLVVHAQLHPEVADTFKQVPPVPVWVVNEQGERSFEKRFTAAA
ncbi:MAG: AMP-binding protein, partial [Candidatus Binatia bacterium]